MMKFVTKDSPPEKRLVVTLEQDGDDVNIMVDGHLLAWLSPTNEGKGRFFRAFVDPPVEAFMETEDGRTKVQ